MRSRFISSRRIATFLEGSLAEGQESRHRRYTGAKVGAMRKIEHNEQQIRELSAGEFTELRNWVLEQAGVWRHIFR